MTQRGSIITQIMACCLTARCHCHNQCWLVTREFQWPSFEGNFTRDTSVINHYNQFGTTDPNLHSNIQGAHGELPFVCILFNKNCLINNNYYDNGVMYYCVGSKKSICYINIKNDVSCVHKNWLKRQLKNYIYSNVLSFYDNIQLLPICWG